MTTQINQITVFEEALQEYNDREGAFIWDENWTRLAACRRLIKYLENKILKLK